MIPSVLLPIENNVIAGRQQSFEAVTKSDDFPAQFFRGEDDAAQNRIQSGAIAATG